MAGEFKNFLRTLEYQKNQRTNNNVKSLQECRECPFHVREEKGNTGGINIVCKKSGDNSKVLIISQPSFYNDSYKNGEIIVKCPG